MGEVYKARDTRLGREVALKFIRDDTLGNRESRLRFLREARTTSIVKHPDIVALYDIFNIGEMEFSHALLSPASEVKVGEVVIA